ncbi:MAG TPA: hypothetical protein VFT22_32715 [Kofleriaceae bacterium]|nr:hypothetical protein [Kofleriaceae bacterium]
MSRRSPSRRSPTCSLGELEPIDAATLASVTGGRITPRTTLDPVLIEGIQKLSQSIVSVGQSLAAAKQGQGQQMLQLVQQMMQARGGR